MARQCSQTPHGSVVMPPLPSEPTQFRARAMMRADVVLPMPRMPVRIYACARRFVSMAFFSVRTKASCPIRSEKVVGRYLRARTRYSFLSVMVSDVFGKKEKETGQRPALNRYGCFLPNLTGLAVGTSVAGFRPLFSVVFVRSASRTFTVLKIAFKKACFPSFFQQCLTKPRFKHLCISRLICFFRREYAL